MLFWSLALLQWRHASYSGRKRSWFLVGLWIGLATIGKQIGVLLFPLIAVNLCFAKRKTNVLQNVLTPVALMVASGAIILLGYLTYSRLWYGDWFSVFRWVDFQTAYVPDREARLALDTQGRGDTFNYLRLLISREFAYIGWIFLCSLGYGLFRKPYRQEAVWGIVYLAFLLFGSVSLTHYKRMWYLQRYILPPIFPMAICFGGMIHDLWGCVRQYIRSFSERRKYVISLTGVFCLTMMFGFSCLLVRYQSIAYHHFGHAHN